MRIVRRAERPQESGLRVAVAFHDGTPNGAVLSVLRAVPHLEERGWKFSFWLPHPSPLFDHLAAEGRVVDGAERHLEGYSLRALRHPPGLRVRARAIRAYLAGFRRFLADQRAALVHANSLFTFAEACVGRAGRYPTVLHIHEIMPGNWKTPAVKAAIALARINPVAVSRASAEPLRGFGLRPAIVHESAPVPDQPSRPRPACRRLVVGSVGVISRRKGSDVFVEAARRVLEQTDAVTFQLVGTYPDTPEAPWAAAVLESARRVGIEHTPAADVYALLREWDVFVLASRIDPFPLVVLEAMACSVPVIGAATDGISEQVTPETGLLVPPDDPGALAESILRLIRMPARQRWAMGCAARLRVEQNFTPEAQAERLHATYLSALSA